MNSFHQSLSFHSFEAAVNGVARLARTQGFRIHQRKSPQKNNYELQGLASFGCTAPGCGWFITLRRLPLDGPSTSTAPAEQWIVYTIYDIHRSTCKPARSRRRRPSISSITSLETENTEDELPPELLRPYERSPSLPIVMHARGSRVGTANATVPVSAEDTFPAQAALTNGHTEPAQVDAPDPLELSKYIQDLLASLDQPPLQADPHATAIDPKALLATLNEPLPLPPGFLVEPQTGTTSNLQYLQQYPFADSNPASTTAQSFSGTLASDLARLPEHLKRGASILDDNVPRTIDPSQLHSPAKVNGYHYHSSSLPSFSYHDQDRHDSPRQGVNDHSYREYAPPVSMDDWSDGDSDDDGEPDLSQDFVQHSYDGPDGAGDFGTETWQEPTNGIDLNNTDNDAGDLQTHDNGDTSSSSDSDIPTEALININTSRSHRSETPRQASHQHSPTYNRQLSQESESLDNNQPDYEPYGPVAPITHTVAAPYSQVSQPAFPAQSKCAAADTLDEPFDIYKIFHSFEEAEAAILSNARKLGLPLKIRYRPNPLDSSMNARRQACLECLRLCGYRIYLKDDHRSQWRVINMEGGHKTSCYQGSNKPKVQRGTNPFRHHRQKDKDSMQVSIPVVQQSGNKRKRREESFSSDRSSSPSILVVTHSDAVMKSVKTMGPGFTPPPEYFHASPSPETVKKFKGKGKSKGQLRKSGHSPDKAIQLDDSDDNDAGDTYHPHIEEEGLPPPLGNPFAKQNSQVPQHGVGSSNSALYARKKLPTTQQLLYGSSRPDILPRHKIPTKPQGRSPALNRARRERRQAYVLASRTDRHGFGGGIGETVPGESSANDDDEDMFYKTDYLNQKGIGDGSSSRALRSAQRQVRVAKRTRSLRSNGHHSHRPLDLDGDFIPSTSDALRSGSQAAAPSRGRPRKDFRTSIHPHIALKMSLTQAGLSPEQMAFMKRGGYATVRDLTREGLACTFGDFTVFSSWLDDLSIPANCNRDVQSARQVVRSRVRTVAEEVRVRSTIVWEAAGMMEEGSDVADDYATSRTQMGHSPINGTQSSHDKYRLEHAMHTDDEDDAQVFRSSQRSPIKKRKSKASYYEANDAPPDPLSDSSGIEFLGVRQ